MLKTRKGVLTTESQKAYDEVAQLFSHWRASTPLGKRRIPAHLWTSAARLTSYFSVSSVATALALDYSTLKKLSQQMLKNCDEPCASEKFIELSPPVVCPSSDISPVHIAQITSSDGAVLKIYSGSITDIIKAFKQS